MSYHRILSKVDDALVAYIVGAGAGESMDPVNPTATPGDTWPAKRSLDRILPGTICEAKSWDSEEGMEFAGNLRVNASITIRTSAALDTGDTTQADAILTASEVRVAEVFDLFYPDADGVDSGTLADALTTAAHAAGIEVTVFGAVVTGGNRTQTSEAWEDVLELSLLCAPSIIT